MSDRRKKGSHKSKSSKGNQDALKNKVDAEPKLTESSIVQADDENGPETASVQTELIEAKEPDPDHAHDGSEPKNVQNMLHTQQTDPPDKEEPMHKIDLVARADDQCQSTCSDPAQSICSETSMEADQLKPENMADQVGESAQALNSAVTADQPLPYEGNANHLPTVAKEDGQQHSADHAPLITPDEISVPENQQSTKGELVGEAVQQPP
eukprot:CAMPEP_0172206438 /NCGR_PEP_ID=MMETSP1050-20130122/33215_1 /TAXON_ID=233186 /ORGANISM="Cryptomonas curvata, Strain CCAP979/52" /LENGTH=209 /DNA_ID=CAMNT_0012885515 /DNA_START=112 /DNA_END=738 /DNA_ORIENTATION=-